MQQRRVSEQERRAHRFWTTRAVQVFLVLTTLAVVLAIQVPWPQGLLYAAGVLVVEGLLLWMIRAQQRRLPHEFRFKDDPPAE